MKDGIDDAADVRDGSDTTHDAVVEIGYNVTYDTVVEIGYNVTYDTVVGDEASGRDDMDENAFLTLKRLNKRATSKRSKRRLCDAAQELVIFFFKVFVTKSGLFLFIFVLFLIQCQILVVQNFEYKSVDGVLEIRTKAYRMIGTQTKPLGYGSSPTLFQSYLL